MKKYLLAFGLVLGLLFPSLAAGLMSHEEEARLGRQVLQMLRKEAQFVEDPEVTGYVAEVGRRLIAHIGPHYFPFKFYVIKDESLNAFAVPGGYIFVNTGLLEEIDREDELAGVLAHELAHVQARHLAKRIEKLTRLNLASAAVTIVGLLLGRGEMGQAIAVTSGALAATKALSYSRADEEEADRLGFQYLTAAGYDPRGFIEVFNKIVRHRWLLSENVPSYLLTHPGTAERITYLESMINYYHPKVTYHPDPFRLRRVQVRVKVFTHDAGSLVVRYRAEIRKSPEDPFLHYGLALALAKLRRFEEAAQEMAYVIEKWPAKDDFRLDLAEIYFQSGRYEKALPILEWYVRRHPYRLGAGYLLARCYQETKRYEEARALYEKLLNKMADNAEFHYHYARLLAALGQGGQAHYQFALHFQL
ncbi:MAG TPA: tetratricopeptide repeat protein, partial [Thermodesulfatator atlanticus]|nr:tetratricopeptide repeat protein [Thermodesulfatator atlanticus]